MRLLQTHSNVGAVCGGTLTVQSSNPLLRSMKAVWNGVLLAESDDTVVVEGNHYFPKDALNEEFSEASSHTSTCFWKGEASYLDVVG